MTRVLLVDDEPLVLIGMQGMLNWAALGYEVVGTARNGAEALRTVQEKQPDIVVSDIRMPVMDGFALAEACHKDGSALPAFIMLTSYEEFDYVKRSMRLGVVDYLVKIDLTADSLTAALEHARDTAEKEKKLRMPSPAPVSLDTFRDRLFLQLYGGLFTDRAVFDRQCAELGVTFKAPRHIVAVGSLPLMTLAARDWAAVLAADPDPDRLHHPDDSEGINLFYHIQAAMAEREVTDFAKTAAPAAPHDVWYPSVGILVSRRGAYALGGKAGSNADSHNHNDVGSVTLYRDGRPLLIDVGVETYSKKTFSPQRYEIWTMQSGWHNLPQFDPDGAKYDQQPGAAFAAADVTVTDALDGLAMDLAPAYGSVPGLGRYRRSVHLTDTGLTLRDETDYPGTVALTLMSVEKPAVDGDTVAFGALAAAAVTGADKIVTETVPITDPRLRQAWPDTLYRTRIYFTQQLSLVIE